MHRQAQTSYKESYIYRHSIFNDPQLVLGLDRLFFLLDLLLLLLLLLLYYIILYYYYL